MTAISGELDLLDFNFEGRDVRVVSRDGAPWFVAKDVCDLLSIRVDNALTSLDEDDHCTTGVTDSIGRLQKSAIVNEPGLYSLILRSRKPQAKAFKRWITHEVIPTIRKTGGAYIAPGSQAEFDLTNPETALDKLIEVAQIAKAERAKRAEVEARNYELTAKVEEDAPKVAAWEALMDADGCYPMATAAQILGTGQNRLYRYLRDIGVLISTAGQRYNTPYQEYAKYFEIKASTVMRNGGEREVRYTTRVRPNGLHFIAKKMGVVLGGD